MNKLGINPKIVQEILGHSSPDMAMEVYTHVSHEDIFEAMKKLDEEISRHSQAN